MIGAREGRTGPIQRLLAHATASRLRAFVVPGLDVARASGLDLSAAGLEPVDSPRRANVFVVITPLPHALVEAAVVVYAQMPRPRAILAIGDDAIPDLPEPDVRTGTECSEVSAGAERLRQIIAGSAWRPGVSPFEHEALAPAEDVDSDSMGHQHHHHGGNGHGHDHQQDMEHSSENGETQGHEEHAQHEGHEEHSGHDQEQSGEYAGHHDHGGHEDHEEHGDHGIHETHEGHEGHGGHGMDHGGHGGGFMSMIAMTKDLPRSPDELQMDWLEVPFGPLHPGLPAGLNLALTLDGDRIASSEVKPGVTLEHAALSTPIVAFELPGHLACLDRLAPGVYRILVEEALAATAKDRKDDGRRIIDLERARVRSHLNWLVSFADLLGYRRLADQAANLQRISVDELQSGDLREIDRACHSFLMRRRLRGIGQLDPATHTEARGPVARAMGLEHDGRREDPSYRALGFQPVIYHDGDAFARLLVRLGEIRQSVDLIQKAREGIPGADSSGHPDSHNAEIETPRGRASIHLTVEHGQVTNLHLDTPSTQHVSLIPAGCEGLELSAGLIAIASLDISPWEVEA